MKRLILLESMHLDINSCSWFFSLICTECYLMLSKASCYMSDMSGKHMGNMWSRFEGSLVQELKINRNIRLKKNRSAEEWAGGDKRHITKDGKEGTALSGRFTSSTTFKKACVCTLTVTNVVKSPLVVLEEGVMFDLIHFGAAQTNRPAHSGGRETESGVAKTHSLLHTPSQTCHPKHASRITALRWPHWPARRAAAAENFYSVTTKQGGNNQQPWPKESAPCCPFSPPLHLGTRLERGVAVWGLPRVGHSTSSQK